MLFINRQQKVFVGFGAVLVILLIGYYLQSIQLNNLNTTIRILKNQISIEQTLNITKDACYFEVYDKIGRGISIRVFNLTAEPPKTECQYMYAMCIRNFTSYNCRWYSNQNTCECDYPTNVSK